MADYGFVHDGRVFTPNATPGLDASTVDARNQAIEAAELARWETVPDRQVAYYKLGEGVTPTWAGLGIKRTGPTIATDCTVTTWRGTQIGRIVALTFYRHNFGGRFVAIRVRGTNGAEYAGRASYDGGDVVRLRKVRSAHAR